MLTDSDTSDDIEVNPRFKTSVKERQYNTIPGSVTATHITATLVTQHKQEAAMAETDQLSSTPFSQIATDDSGPPIVHYGMQVPVAASTPTGTDVHVHSSQQEDFYQQIIPGIPQGSLYPTLSSLSSGAVASDTDVQSLWNKVTKGLDKYLQDAEQLCASEVNYFDDTARPTNTLMMLETTEEVNESSQNNLPTAKQESIEEIESAINVLESLKIDTGHTLQHQRIKMKTVNNIDYKTRLNKTQRYIMMMMGLQQKTLLQKPLQLSQNSHLQHFFLPMTSLYQLKR